MSTVRWYDSKWSEKEKQEFDKALAISKPVLTRLIEILEKDIETSQRKQRDEGNFLKPSWSELQAYLLGEQKALYKVLNIIS